MLSSPSSSSSPSPSLSTSKTRNSNPDTRTESKWKAPSQQRLYNRRLLDALSCPGNRPGSARAIKYAADSALALTARGQSRWSRAILTSRCRRVQLKAGGKVRRKKPEKPAMPKKPVIMTTANREVAKEGKVEERLRRLGRLVPGCRKLAAPSLLEEAADYMAALEVQVKVMRGLVEAMANTGLTGPTEEEEELGLRFAWDQERRI